tara:strand:- start:885 stop:1601 length:717 start_codon:yes stop_codon:yes gene_type:complete
MAKAEQPTKVRLTKRELAKMLREVLSKEFEKELRSVSAPYVKQAIEQGVEFGSSQMVQSTPRAGAGSGRIATVSQKQIHDIAQRQIVRLSSEIGRYTRIRLRNMLGEGIERGETIPELANRVQEWAGDVGDEVRGTRARATMIARTETSRAVIEGQIESYESTGVVDRKEWLLSPHSCEFCKAIVRKSKKISLRNAFMEKGSVLQGVDGGTMKLDYSTIDGPPLHPNCRCALKPVLER